MPKRPKGRLFVGGVLLAVCGFVGFQVWNGFFRYRAYGTVVGRVIEVSAPWDGAVHFMHVREGEQVRQGQVLVTLDNLELRQRLAEAGDEMRIAQATLAAQVSQLHWQAQTHTDMTQKAAADYFDAWGKLLQEHATLTELELRLERVRKLEVTKVVTQEEQDHSTLAVEGQRERVNKLILAVEELRKRSKAASSRDDDGTAQLQPHVLRIEVLQAELVRLRDQLAQGTVRAPVDGVVVRRDCFSGEHAAAREPLLSILEEGSLEVVLYLNQDDGKLLALNDVLGVRVEPYDKPIRCQVTRLGTQLESAPQNIKRHYHSEQKLLPVYLTPTGPNGDVQALRVGGVATLPSGWSWSDDAASAGTPRDTKESSAPLDLTFPDQVVPASAILPIGPESVMHQRPHGPTAVPAASARGYLARRLRSQAIEP
ncbi:MAG TPA: HlyD family efflux transporter periplasmic adaptor subunit [Pirellulales bacterium]|nr:HlyD family efflux transporter periplasmic adaptor subunit [Pirellulales bacterium]